MTLAELNRSDRATFIAALGWIFEDSPWVAERTWQQRPFASVDRLHHAMVASVNAARADERLALLRAHPDLGARARMSEASAGEQTGAGLDHLAPHELERLHRLNDAYRAKFGFPFLLAVKGSTKEQVLSALEQRLEHEADEELAEALRQVSRIAKFRLEDTVG